MANKRDIYNRNPDPVAQFNARIAGWNTRDLTGLPLGDVLGHGLNRLAVCYGVLNAAHLAGAYGRMGAKPGLFKQYRFEPVGAIPQDWRGSKEYPAAHLAPCSLLVFDPTGAKQAKPLFDIFADGVTRSHVRGLFAKTELVHVLVNYADSRCEGTPKGGKQTEKTGFAQVLARACDRLIHEPQAKPRDVMYGFLAPGFRAVIGERIRDFTQESLKLQDDFLEAPSDLVDARGRPFDWNPERSDLSIKSASPEALKANRRAVLQALDIYASIREPRLADIARSDGEFAALRLNEIRESMKR